MPAPVYAPDGRTSASPSSTSITEEAPHWEITWRVSANARSGTSAVLSGLGLFLRSTEAGRPTPRAASERAPRLASAFPAAFGSSLTTFPMAASLYGQLARKPISLPRMEGAEHLRMRAQAPLGG